MLRIAQATPADLAEIVKILQEMDSLYSESDPEPGGSKARQIGEVLFSDNPQVYGLLAYDGAQAAGFASYSYLWPAVLTSKSLYLKELYVARNNRRRGVGAALMQHILSIADQNECSRVEWTTDLGNFTAQRFCESLGFTSLRYKVYYQADDFEITRASERLSRRDVTDRQEPPDSTRPFDRITVDPGKMGGQPCIRGHRFTVEQLLRLAGAGWTLEQIQEEFTFIEAPDLQQAIAYASLLILGTFTSKPRR